MSSDLTLELPGPVVCPDCGYAIRAESGSFAQTGSSAALRAARRIASDGSAYILSGSSAGLHRGMRVSAGVGAFALTGLAASLRHLRVLPAGPGTYILDGQEVMLIYYPTETCKLARVSMRGKSASVGGHTKSPHVKATMKKGAVDFKPL